jgi:hypothetical protein
LVWRNDEARDAIEGERKDSWSFFARYPSAVLYRAVDVLQMFIGVLKGYAGLPVNAPIGSIPKPSQIYRPC